MIAPAGRRLGKYEIRQKLGRGGMADVYLAFDSETARTVALKLIEHSADTDTCDSIEAERRGALLQARLAAVDPHVVRVYQCGDLDGFFFVAMEFIAGRDLAEWMHGGPLTPEFAAEVAQSVAETLDHAHNLDVEIDGKRYHGIVHGDIKPKNIRIGNRAEVRVLDFGIAKALSLSRRLTRNEFGSVPYASPERLDSGDVDLQSDLWALAVMLYEMVTGLQPYQAASTERLETMIRSRIPPPPPPDPCPEQLRRILVRAMTGDPGARFPSALAFSQELAAFRAAYSSGRRYGPAPANPAPEPLAIPSPASTGAASDADDTRRTTSPDHGQDATRRTSESEQDDTRRTRSETGNDAAAALALQDFEPGFERIGELGVDSGNVADATRRTPQTLVWPPRSARRQRRRSIFTRVVQVISVLAIIAFFRGIWSWNSAYQGGQDLARRIQSEQVTDPEQIWSEWTELSHGDSSSYTLRGTRDLVNQKLRESAERTIAAYRISDGTPVPEKDWERARSLLVRAMSLGPNDTVRGELRLAEGHIARIEGGLRKDPTQMRDAVQDFDEAARLLPRSPDPELGLARVYLSNTLDIDKASEALDEAGKRGYPPGNREKLQLAYAYMIRGDREFWDSRDVRGLPQEKDQVQRAADDYWHAVSLYQAIAPYGNANSMIKRLGASLESVTVRLSEIAQTAQVPQ
jgi:serine/threonine protein kinase